MLEIEIISTQPKCEKIFKLIRNIYTVPQKKYTANVTYHPHPLLYFWYYLSGFCSFIIALFGIFLWSGLFIFLLILSFIYFFLIELLRRAHTFYVTKTCIIKQYKLFVKRKKSILYDRIQFVYYSQSIVGRIFGYGTLFISTSGTGDIEVQFEGIKDPSSIKILIQKKMSVCRNHKLFTHKKK